jgi:hypothetical protein
VRLIGTSAGVEAAILLREDLVGLDRRLAVRRDFRTVSSGRRSLPMHPRNVTSYGGRS